MQGGGQFTVWKHLDDKWAGSSFSKIRKVELHISSPHALLRLLDDCSGNPLESIVVELQHKLGCLMRNRDNILDWDLELMRWACAYTLVDDFEDQIHKCCHGKMVWFNHCVFIEVVSSSSNGRQSLSQHASFHVSPRRLRWRTWWACVKYFFCSHGQCKQDVHFDHLDDYWL